MNYQEKLIKKFEETIKKELDKLEKTKNKEEKLYKLNELYKMHKVLLHYEELEPVFKEYFYKKAREEKFKGEER